MMRTFGVACLFIVAASDTDKGTAKRFLKGRRDRANASTEHVDLQPFDMSPLTDAEMNSTCGEAFVMARGAASVCIEAAQMAVNKGTEQVNDYNTKLCLCRDTFDKKMSICTVNSLMSDHIKARAHNIEEQFDAYCAVGDTLSPFEIAHWASTGALLLT